MMIGINFLILILLLALRDVFGATECELLAPLEFSPAGPEFGIVFVPGDNIPGDSYR